MFTRNLTCFPLFPTAKCQNIFHWSGSESNRFERLKTTELAIDIRDNERRGRAELHLIDEGSEPEEVIKVSFFFYYLLFLLKKEKKTAVILETSGNVCDCGCVKEFIWLIWLLGRM